MESWNLKGIFCLVAKFWDDWKLDMFFSKRNWERFWFLKIMNISTTTFLLVDVMHIIIPVCSKSLVMTWINTSNSKFEKQQMCQRVLLWLKRVVTVGGKKIPFFNQNIKKLESVERVLQSSLERMQPSPWENHTTDVSYGANPATWKKRSEDLPFFSNQKPGVIGDNYYPFIQSLYQSL